MKNGKYSKNHGLNLRPIVLMLAVVLLIGGTIGGTIAWLTDTTDEVENTFTVGNIDITLEETKKDFKMIPGWTIDKDPIVTVKADSEDCWVFVKVEESENLKKYIDYTIDPNNWTKLDSVEGVYYCKATNVTKDTPIKVLGYKDAQGNFVNNKVLVNDTVTKEMMDDLLKKDADGKVILDEDGNPTYDTKKLPKLTFTAYAVQLYSSNGVEFKPADAWAKIATP